MNCSLPGSSIHGILQARILEWVAIPFPGDLLDPWIEFWSSALWVDSLPYELPGNPKRTHSMRLLNLGLKRPCSSYFFFLNYTRILVFATLGHHEQVQVLQGLQAVRRRKALC